MGVLGEMQRKFTYLTFIELKYTMFIFTGMPYLKHIIHIILLYFALNSYNAPGCSFPSEAISNVPSSRNAIPSI